MSRTMSTRAAKAIRLGIHVAHLDPLGFLVTSDYQRIMGTRKFYALSADAYQRTYERLCEEIGQA
jgi:hypothetical protein